MSPRLSNPVDSFWWYERSGEERVIFWICVALLVQFSICAPILTTIQAPYGRYNQAADKQQKGFALRALSACDMNARAAWILQECPTLIAAALCWMTGSEECKRSVGNCAVLLCFVVHYVNRTWVYPLRMKGSKPTPLPVMLMAMCFCALNGYIQCRSLTRFFVITNDSWSLPCGLLLWSLGLWINTDADRILRSLRKPGETGYKIPYGGMFAYVSGANFFGEIVEWIGFAVAMGCALPGLTFAICTAANIGPRAISHHKWYIEKFKDEYPKGRMALIPFVL